jgi:hypothetical protein
MFFTISSIIDVTWLLSPEVHATRELSNQTQAVFSSIEKYTIQKKFSVTSNLRYMHEVLNADKIKN